MPGKRVRGRWYLDLHGIRREGTRETGFTFRDAHGVRVDGDKTLARIRKLSIPPAWQEVRIARGHSAPLQAVGVDKRGRTQYLYHPRFRAHQEEEKFKRVVEFGEALPALRRRVRADLKRAQLDRDHVLAAIVRLIDQGFFRVGNDKSAQSEATYGLTTIHARHVKVKGPLLMFDYVGKWRKTQKRVIEDPEVAAIVEKLRKLDEPELFAFLDNGKVRDVKDRHVNDYIQSIIGATFTAKDFRTWAGTLLCSIALGMEGQGDSKTERKRKIKRAVQTTADQLGNTPAVCRSSYICPRLLHEYMGGKPFEALRKRHKGSPVVRTDLSKEERALLRFLLLARWRGVRLPRLERNCATRSVTSATRKTVSGSAFVVKHTRCPMIQFTYWGLAKKVTSQLLRVGYSMARRL